MALRQSATPEIMGRVVGYYLFARFEDNPEQRVKIKEFQVGGHTLIEFAGLVIPGDVANPVGFKVGGVFTRSKAAAPVSKLPFRRFQHDQETYSYCRGPRYCRPR